MTCFTCFMLWLCLVVYESEAVCYDSWTGCGYGGCPSGTDKVDEYFCEAFGSDNELCRRCYPDSGQFRRLNYGSYYVYVGRWLEKRYCTGTKKYLSGTKNLDTCTGDCHDKGFACEYVMIYDWGGCYQVDEASCSSNHASNPYNVYRLDYVPRMTKIKSGAECGGSSMNLGYARDVGDCYTLCLERHRSDCQYFNFASGRCVWKNRCDQFSGSSMNVYQTNEIKSSNPPNYAKIKLGHECVGGSESYLGVFDDIEQCYRKCVAKKQSGCKYFIFGRDGGKTGKCWWEGSCDKFTTNSYDVFEVYNTKVASVPGLLSKVNKVSKPIRIYAYVIIVLLTIFALLKIIICLVNCCNHKEKQKLTPKYQTVDVHMHSLSKDVEAESEIEKENML